ncbi:Sarcosine dehydrogenase [hydrothermal vent metagenome]|uniref:Sarcosine dehydrogenase n=1 Tax=hydrothermal vent metagenome TaxID=652676 RepID=A0A3B0T8I4_9ZZZZ
MSQNSSFPAQTRVVIIGGGIVGCSVAYHLAKLGWSDVVMLERAKLTSGSTFHAAGLVGQLRSNANVTRLLTHSVELYARLEAETGLATGWKMSGCLRLACNPERMIDYRRQATTARSFGLEMQILSADECRRMWPIMDGADVVGGCFMPSDGQANPSDITQALARGARGGGIRIIEDCGVDAILVRDAKVAGVSTPQGDIACEVVVNCAGQWAREVGALAGVNVPLVSVQHQFMITEPIAGLSRDMPTIRDPDRLIYFKEEVGGLVAGVYEPNPKPWAVDGIPKGFHFSLLDSDWEHFEPAIEQCIARVPALARAGIKDLVNGPESFTPDGNFILGEAPEVENFFVGAGFNAFGIASGGGAGKALAEWVVAGEPPMDLWPVDIRRFGPHHHDIDWVRARTQELYAKHYTMPWPFEEHRSGRPRMTSRLYDRLKAAGACFGEKMAWERPNWFAPKGVEPKDEYSFGRQNWFKHVGEEHRAVRERAGLFDQSSFAKFEMAGPDAEKALSWICAANVAGPPGKLTYTQMLNSRGGIECDLTVARLAEDRFYLVTGTGFRTHDFTWIRRNIPKGCEVDLVDVTEDRFTLSLMGPASRDILRAVTDTDMSNEAFAFATCRTTKIAGADVTAFRITYVGELGWELHGSAENAGTVYDAIKAAGEAHGLTDCGYRAIESLRLEKGYRAWGADIGPDYTPDEAGLGWAVKMKSNTSFIGRDAIAAGRGKPLTKQLACFTVDDPETVLLGRETIYRDGLRVGWLSSAGWGYTIGKNIGYGYVRDPGGVDADYLASGAYELEVATERVACEIHFAPLYDPSNARVKS